MVKLVVFPDRFYHRLSADACPLCISFSRWLLEILTSHVIYFGSYDILIEQQDGSVLCMWYMITHMWFFILLFVFVKDLLILRNTENMMFCYASVKVPQERIHH